jgi:hypothetical protein
LIGTVFHLPATEGASRPQRAQQFGTVLHRNRGFEAPRLDPRGVRLCLVDFAAAVHLRRAAVTALAIGFVSALLCPFGRGRR